MTFLLLYCHYDPDEYRGHRVHTLEAKDLAAAKVEARAFLDKWWVRMNFEFRIVETCYDSGCRLWDTRDPPMRPNENEFTVREYWDKPS